MIEVEVEVAVRARALVGEGPVWDERTQTLVWVDIMGNAVHVYDPTSGQDRALDVGQPVGAAALRQGGGLVLAMRDGFALLDDESQELRWVASVESDLPTNRMNDGKCDAAGRFWAGTMGIEARRGVGSFYRLDANYEVTRFFEDVTISNGLDWTLDNKHLYYIDSPSQCVDVIDFDVERGVLGERRELFRIPREVGLPDGMTLDADGNLWVALHGAGMVHCYSPGGELLARAHLPVKQVTCPAFGGADYGDLYITTMTLGLSEDALAAQPLAGSVFRCRPGVHGRAPFRFAG